MENKFRIPKKFKLLGQTYTVEYNNEKCDGANAYGLAVFDTNTIYLTDALDKKPIADDIQAHTFFHELTHHILHAMGREKLCRDEKFVDLFGGMLHQVAITMEYDTPDWSKIDMMPKTPPKIAGDRPVG